MKKILLGLVIVVVITVIGGPWVLTQLGRFLVVDSETIDNADAVVVLSTGVDYLPRLMQAANLYREGKAEKVVINGNRKTDIHRRLEQQGYVSPYHWYDKSVSVLNFLGVVEDDIVIVDAEDAYDTVSEAGFVGPTLKQQAIDDIIITTSKFHTRRAIAIWRYLYEDDFKLQIVSAKDDPFDVAGWWRNGRQMRQLLAEYGAWLYFWGKRLDGEAAMVN